MRVLINAANLRHGGGVQVAASFLDELATLVQEAPALEQFPWLPDVEVLASPEVLLNTREATVASLGVQQRSATVDLRALLRRRVDVSFTVFGPEYVPTRARHRVVGFADGTSLRPELVPVTMRSRRGHWWLRRWVSRALFTRVETLVTEAPHVAQQLADRWRIDPDRVHVIPNTVHAVFDRPEDWLPSPLVREQEVPHVLFVTRGYAHKNLSVLGFVGEEMERHGRTVRFVLTLDEPEWQSLPERVRAHSTNLGPVAIQQLPLLYRACDASIFPSLLESFSVTPLEALHTGTPLVASDREFVRQITGDAALLADPEDPVALARALTHALDEGHGERVKAGLATAQAWPSARSRALAYLRLIDRVGRINP